MSRIIKITHERQFAQIANSTLRDWRLSLKARGLLAVIISLPDDWAVTVEWIAKQGSDGRDAVRSAMAELEEHGYARYVPFRQPNGLLFGGHWEVKEEASLPWLDGESPTTENPKSVKPKSEEPKSENPKSLENNEKEYLPLHDGSILTPEPAPKAKNKARATLDEIKAFCKAEGLPESDATSIFYRWEGNGWRNGGTPIKCWKSTIRSHRAAGYLPSQRVGGGGGKATGVRNAGTVNSADDYGR